MSEVRSVARSPVPPAPPVAVVAGWEVSVRRSTAALRLADWTPLAKVLLRGPELGGIEQSLGVPHRSAAHTRAGHLVVGSGPGEWLVLAAPGAADAVAGWLGSVGSEAGEFHAVVDVTHGRVLVRLTGADTAAMLPKVCAIDFADDVTPNGAAFRSSVARVTTDVVRDDVAGVRSYLLHCDRSYGRYLFASLLDAGAEFGIDVDGFAPDS
ncbi:MAG TPA: sarcosine oxidase subunit gamma family protein [Jiangellaceae bacterium]|nr:sarcosine oxidase subunit gamma family protein [Jiangellaceae bacterium]